jgi:hypothetical protein
MKRHDQSVHVVPMMSEWSGLSAGSLDTALVLFIARWH